MLRTIYAHWRAYRWLRRVERNALPSYGLEPVKAESKTLPLLFEGDATRELVRRSLGEGPFRDVAPVAIGRVPETRALVQRAALGCAVLLAQGFWVALLYAR